MLSGIAVLAACTAEMKQDAAHKVVLAAIFVLTIYPVVLAFFDQSELSTDRAEYRFWGQSFDFGGYFHPLLIGRIVGLSTDLAMLLAAAVALIAQRQFAKARLENRPSTGLAAILAFVQRRKSDGNGALPLLVLTPILIAVLQPVKVPALANWAILCLVPGSVFAAFWLLRHPWLVGAAIQLGLAVSLTVPRVKALGFGLAGRGDTHLLARSFGHGVVAEPDISTAQASGAGTMVAEGGDIMANLSWFGASAGLVSRAMPPEGRPFHHWEATSPFNPKLDPEPICLQWAEARLQPCAQTAKIGRFETPPRAYGGRIFAMLSFDTPGCLFVRGATHG